MKLIIVLNKRYLWAHKRQFTAMILSIAVFCTAILTLLLVRECITYTNQQTAYEKSGREATVSYLADLIKVNSQKTELEKMGAGIVSMEGFVSSASGDSNVYLGNFDANALALRSIRPTEGRMPQTENEVAIEENTYYQLNLTASVGSRITLPVTFGNKTEEKNYALVGILADYAQDWEFKINQLYQLDGLSNQIVIPGVLTKSPVNPQSVHVLFPNLDQRLDVGGKEYDNVWRNAGEGDAAGQNRVATVVTTLLMAFFWC